MNNGQAEGLHYLTRAPIRLTWRAGVISAIETIERAPENRWLAPALVELQVNGYGGVGFWEDTTTADDLITAVRALTRDGCGRTLLTLITDHWQPLLARIQRYRGYIARSPELKQHFAGWHIEGPFVSDVSGYKGAHDAARTCDGTIDKIRELREVTGDDPLLLTLAPERGGAMETIALATSLGLTVSLGHTNASADTLRAAVAAGARAFTHLGNGCPQALDRHDNIVWRVLDTPGLMVGIIPDAIHVSPMAFRVMHRALDMSRIYYTTDAVSPAGMPPGRYKMDGIEFDVGEDQVVREPGKTNFSGSALRPVEGVFRAAEMLGCPWQETWHRFSQQPADFMRLEPLLAVGQLATFCLIDQPGSDAGTVTTHIAGVPAGTVSSRAKLTVSAR
jgi:N-acetylglucosamine-6-phosphate deacetylase